MSDSIEAIDEPRPLTPEARAKPGARGKPITMADGLDWLVRVPRFVWVPGEGDDVAVASDIGPAYDAAFSKLENAASGIDQIRGILALAKMLVAENYDLDPADFKRLLRVDFAATPEGEEETAHAKLARALKDLVLS